MTGGVWKEIVYDNMRNVVSKFIGKNEKELNEELVKMANYYGFRINVIAAFQFRQSPFSVITGKKRRKTAELACPRTSGYNGHIATERGCIWSFLVRK
jgi:hypothetical protein